MGYALCTAEKPSVATDIARVLGASNRHDGYFEGNGYLVTWARGHLVQLAEPQTYGYLPQSEIYGEQSEKALAELPITPSWWSWTVIEDVKAQYEVVRKLMHREDVDYIIDCGDMGPEGHILQWLIRQKAGCTKPVKRFCATSLTDEAILDAMQHLRDEAEFLPIIKGELCKKKADWMLGISLSRAESLKYKAAINVGRVQSPTLGFVVQRFLEVQRFQRQSFFTLTARIRQGEMTFDVFWSRDKDGVLPSYAKDGAGRCLDEPVISRCANKIAGAGQGEVLEVSSVRRATQRPQLYDILELQRESNRKYGYSAALTLAAAQSLYESHKILSYPRTDSRYITSDLVPYMESRVRGIGRIDRYAGVVNDLLKHGLNIDGRVVDDTKVTDHHAIIPTTKIQTLDLNSLEPTKEEVRKGVSAEVLRNVLDLVLTRVLVALAEPYKYEQTAVTVLCDGGFKLSATGTKPISIGWKAIQTALAGEDPVVSPHGEEEPEQVFPQLSKGQMVEITNCEIVKKKTTPPELHTEDTLLGEMKNAGQRIENGEILKGRGIGTQATRAEIIKGLFDTQCIELKKKNKKSYLVPTQKGLSVIRVLPPELYSPKITADWEQRIALIATGKATEQDFMDEFIPFLKEKTNEILSGEVADISFYKEREIVARCPWCGASVYRWQKTEGKKTVRSWYYCSNKEQCAFGVSTDDTVFKARLGRNCTDKEAVKLISKGALVVECKRKADGTPYKGEFTIVRRETTGSDGTVKVYCNIKCDVLRRSK